MVVVVVICAGDSNLTDPHDIPVSLLHSHYFLNTAPDTGWLPWHQDRQEQHHVGTYPIYDQLQPACWLVPRRSQGVSVCACACFWEREDQCAWARDHHSCLICVFMTRTWPPLWVWNNLFKNVAYVILNMGLAWSRSCLIYVFMFRVWPPIWV